MELLTFAMGGQQLLVRADHVERVEVWPSPTDFRVADVRRLLSLPTEGALPSPRLLVSRSATGERVGVLVPGPLQQRASAATPLWRSPRLLSRLKAPTWLAGFAELGERLCIVLDVKALAEKVSETPPASNPQATTEPLS